MSRSAYGAIEVRDKETGKWKFLKINFLVDGWESSVDIYLCSGSFASAIMGEQDFDYVEERDESAPSKKERRLNEIDTWFDKRVRGSNMKLRDDFSKELADRLTPDSEDPFSHAPTNITFTYGDLQYLKNTAKLVSKRAANFYKKNFSNIERILEFVSRNYGEMWFTDSSDTIRMTVFVV